MIVLNFRCEGRKANKYQEDMYCICANRYTIHAPRLHALRAHTLATAVTRNRDELWQVAVTCVPFVNLVLDCSYRDIQ